MYVHVWSTWQNFSKDMRNMIWMSHTDTQCPGTSERTSVALFHRVTFSRGMQGVISGLFWRSFLQGYMYLTAQRCWRWCLWSLWSSLCFFVQRRVRNCLYRYIQHARLPTKERMWHLLVNQPIWISVRNNCCSTRIDPIHTIHEVLVPPLLLVKQLIDIWGIACIWIWYIKQAILT